NLGGREEAKDSLEEEGSDFRGRTRLAALRWWIRSGTRFGQTRRTDSRRTPRRARGTPPRFVLPAAWFEAIHPPRQALSCPRPCPGARSQCPRAGILPAHSPRIP